MSDPIDLSKLTQQEQDALFLELQAKKCDARKAEREAYQSLKHEFVKDTVGRALEQRTFVTDFYGNLVSDVEGFRAIMAEYGAISTKQMSFTLIDGDFKFEVKTNKVKRFDERADLAAQRLITFLKFWVKGQDKGTEDPMYQLAMMAIERNSRGDMDYKQVSNLYKLECQFNSPEYSVIMELFRESHIIEGTATNFYFYRRNEMGVWKKIEISFNRL